MPARRWMLVPRRPEPEAELCGALGVSPLLARLLVNRDVITPEAASAFLTSKLAEHLRSPMLFRDMGRAAERVVAAVNASERIGIYGDYDVDGISGSAILVTFLRALGHEPVLHIPHRLNDGYGVTEPGVRRLAEQGARVMITVDCGGVAHRELALARELGMDAIVCDHHQVSGTPLPAHAVLNPIEPDSGFPFAGLCGAGVAFYLALGVRMRLRESGAAVPDLRRYLDLVTLGTIADIVPIVEENRVLVKHGLRELTQSVRPGIIALKTVSGVADVTTGTVGFRLAPRLNAGGRLADATRSVELLTTTDKARAEQLAQELDQENRARQTIEVEILNDAIAQVEATPDFAERRSIVLASEDWHPGVIGIVASRLVERYYRPTILIAVNLDTGIGRGSGRSIRGFNLHEAMGACREVLEGFGGHRMAAGLSIRAEQVDDFAGLFEEAVRARTRAEQFVPETTVDAELSFRDIDQPLMDDLDRLEPFGMGNPEPIFCTRGATVASRKIVGENHLRLYLKHDGRGIGAIGFGMADRDVPEGATVDLLYSPQQDEWNGETRLQLRLRDIRLARDSNG
ncbi:MAG: single-stranded-DNA-specific exonuclease RecJ [Deltaproteobacteria bacterium]|nr:single-stranded-DNA-specific exonuclease RecJ [Deltaproteobacteria bacterium]MBI3388414.1 single-stranded-DNA-specific exonuclease RecJ [Deltaproteobacteria bacterium]